MALNILIVDDSTLTRKKVKRIIEMADLDVEEFFEAGNGAEALDVLTEAHVDLVLSDLNMPEMSGAEMIQQMKSNAAMQSIPVVVISTESQTTRIKELLANGVEDYLHKPFTPEEFKETLQGLWSKTTIEVGKLLTEAMAEALETMAFLTIMPVDDDMVIPDKTISAQISFSGPKSGTIEILAGVGFCRNLAENMGGLAVADHQSGCDALKELSNVACGLFLPMVVSSTADLFDVTVPVVISDSDSPQWDEFTSDQSSCVLNIEGQAVATRLTITAE